MRITEVARSVGLSPRMLRYREALGLLPTHRNGGTSHRTYTQQDVDLIRHSVELEQRYSVSPTELAFGLRVLADPTAAAALRDLGERLGIITPPPSAVEWERERALRWLGRSGMAPPPPKRRT